VSRPWENARTWTQPDGWIFGTKKHAGHACGWTCVHPADDPGGFRAKVVAHEAVCPWPGDPEPVETPSD
jgi:hypothetical protein